MLDLIVAPGSEVTRVDQAVANYHEFRTFVSNILREGLDYGVIPGTTTKALKKPGAEKLANFFGLTMTFETVEAKEVWEEPLFFYYRSRCILTSADGRQRNATGSANSKESRYAWRWVPEQNVPAHLDKAGLLTRGGRISEYDFAIEKAQTDGQYGKPAEYWARFTEAIANGSAKRVRKTDRKGTEREAWEIDSSLYRVPNPDIADQANTILKISEKRALVAVVLMATGASEYFTQDLDEDIIDDATYVTATVGMQPEVSARIKSKWLGAAVDYGLLSGPDDHDPEHLNRVRSALGILYSELETFRDEAESELIHLGSLAIREASAD